MLQTPAPMTWPTTIAFIGSIVGVAASFFVCPLTAYFNRKTIFALSDSLPLQIVFFSVMGLSHLVFLVSYFTITVVYPWLIESRAVALQQEKVDERDRLRRRSLEKLENVPIVISASDAVITENVGESEVATVVLRINHVPATVPEYHISLSAEQEEEIVGYRFFGFENENHPKGSIKAVNTERVWKFYNPKTGEPISDDPENVPVRLSILDLDRDVTTYPTSITLQISVSAENGIPGLESVWWSKPVKTVIVRPSH